MIDLDADLFNSLINSEIKDLLDGRDPRKLDIERADNMHLNLTKYAENSSKTFERLSLLAKNSEDADKLSSLSHSMHILNIRLKGASIRVFQRLLVFHDSDSSIGVLGNLDLAHQD